MVRKKKKKKIDENNFLIVIKKRRRESFLPLKIDENLCCCFLASHRVGHESGLKRRKLLETLKRIRSESGKLCTFKVQKKGAF